MSAAGADSLDNACIDTLLAPLRSHSPLVAVSGGPDSTALLVMAAEWAARAGGHAPGGGDRRSRPQIRKRGGS